ncbi:MAG: hypothetical protein R3F62_13145 [Planctomycetota bacterium]
MDAAHRDALRAWREDPRDPEAYAALVAACRRGGEPLPPEADPETLIETLTRRALEVYREDERGDHAHYAAWGRVGAADPDLDTLRRAHRSLFRPSAELFVFGCHAVRSRAPCGGLLFPCFNGDLDRPRFHVDLDNAERERFRALDQAGAALLESLPGARTYRVEVEHLPQPVDLVWSLDYLIEVPAVRESYLLVVQYT